MKPSSDTDSQSFTDDLLDERNSVGLLACVVVGSGLVGLVTHLVAAPVWIMVTATIVFVLVSPLILRFIRRRSSPWLIELLPICQRVNLLGVAATAVMIAIAGWLIVELNIGVDGRVIMTGMNDSTTTRLPDGTVLSVDARSTVKVNVTEQQRVAHLIEGAVTFDVAQDGRMPFIVETYLAKVTAPVAKFRVAIDSSVSVVIEVYEGAVQVSARGLGPQGIKLEKGEIYRVPGDGGRAVAANTGGFVTRLTTDPVQPFAPSI